MKNILLLVLIAGLFFACNSSKREEVEMKKMIGGILPNAFVESDTYNNKDEIETEKAKIIIEAIQNKNFVTLQSLFQPSVVDSAQTMYDDALALFDYIGIDTYEITDVSIYESAQFGDGEGAVSWVVGIGIKADNIDYWLGFIDVRKNYARKDDIGIKTLKFLEDEKYGKYTIHIQDLEPGIFNPARHTISEQ